MDPEKTGITKVLAQLQITSAKPKVKPYNLSDGQGLVLAIQATGSKLWRFRYRYAGRQKTLHIGPWPATSLAHAREKCREARKAIAAGLDPALEKKRAKVTARFAVATTFKDVALEWIAKCEREGRAEITLDKIRWLLGMAYPLIGSHPINAISPIEALTALRKVEAKARYESAWRDYKAPPALVASSAAQYVLLKLGIFCLPSPNAPALGGLAQHIANYGAERENNFHALGWRGKTLAQHIRSDRCEFGAARGMYAARL